MDNGIYFKIAGYVDLTILVLPVLLDEEYWSFRYCE
jgi:hypothetical protein